MFTRRTSRRTASLAPALALTLLSACAAPGETWTLRGTLAGTPFVPTPLYGSMGPVPPPDPAYAADLSRLQAGLPAVNVSQVTIAGGQIHVPVGGGILQRHSDWRPHGATTFTVAECSTVAVSLQRIDKGGATALYATRAAGVVSLSRMPPAAPCTIAPGAQTFPSAGSFRLFVPDVVQHAVVTVMPWGSPVPGTPAYPPGSYASPYGYAPAPLTPLVPWPGARR